MTRYFKIFLTVILLGLATWAQAQDRDLQYYNTHESEILPDARAAYRVGRYERAVELCRWHYIIVGDNSADTFREMAESCAQLSRRMTSLKEDGKKDEAREAARTLLSINPNDPVAQQLLEELEKAEEPETVPEEPVTEPVPVVRDTVEAVPVPEVKDTVRVEVPETKLEEVTEEPVQPVVQEPVRKLTPQKASQTRFVVKAGATAFLSPFSVAPGGGIGIYDMGGSPVGLEAGLYFGSLAEKTASLFGLDAGLVFRVSDSLYPKVGVGYFSCKSKESGNGTNGLCGGASLTFLVGGHFCIEVGAKYYPKVNVKGTTTVTTAGTSYNFPTPVEVLGGGIAPVVSLGFAF